MKSIDIENLISNLISDNENARSDAVKYLLIFKKQSIPVLIKKFMVPSVKESSADREIRFCIADVLLKIDVVELTKFAEKNLEYKELILKYIEQERTINLNEVNPEKIYFGHKSKVNGASSMLIFYNEKRMGSVTFFVENNILIISIFTPYLCITPHPSFNPRCREEGRIPGFGTACRISFLEFVLFSDKKIEFVAGYPEDAEVMEEFIGKRFEKYKRERSAEEELFFCKKARGEYFKQNISYDRENGIKTVNGIRYKIIPYESWEKL